MNIILDSNIVDYDIVNIFNKPDEKPERGEGANEKEIEPTEEELESIEDDEEVKWEDVEDGNDSIQKMTGSGVNEDNDDESGDSSEVDEDGEGSSIEETDSDEFDDEKEEKMSGTEDNPDEDSGNDNDEKTEETDNGEKEDSDKSDDDTKSDNEDDNDSPAEPKKPVEDELTEEEIKKLIDALKIQEEFGDGEVEKEAVSEQKRNSVEAIEDAGVDIETVGLDGNFGCTKGINTIVIKKLTKSLIDANPFKIFLTELYQKHVDNIEMGIRLGTMLGRKIQIRNEERSTQYTRLKNGKIDKRLINSIGYGAEQVFCQTQIDKFNPVLLHMSIDASGSMHGAKWNRTMIAVTAICKAASMVSNLHVVVNFRTTTNQLSGDSEKEQPIVVVAYDSRIDKFEKIRRLFPYLNCPGTTPEGLCFEAIERLIKADKTQDQYFINFSDGMPFYKIPGFDYEGHAAEQHTKKQVENMRSKGIKILSYYITDSARDTISDAFKTMYGKDAALVDINGLVPLAKSINALFLER